ncbi:tyrosine-protein phosphatase non-receptor type 23 [Protopterus annectens]|uniref:tyrosine-protein phosphatase non-receptor type 23 n=1 Tax=Protopterus annectens TaxID=7888 RepID=UPI001CFB53F4|nr:tyrosine-protein phosphatase non-receptor type 23 [Protopterus annectens]
MEAVPRMPMIWLDLKEAGDFHFASAVRQFILKQYGENPDNYNEELKKLEQLRQSAVTVARDFEGCSTLRKYFGQLHYLQSRVPMGSEQEACVPVTWTEIFSGKTVTHNDISYEQACILYNLGALHSMLGAMDNRVSEEGMKVSCTHFQCSAGAFAYLQDHFVHSYSVDMSHQILNLNINLMLGQAQECLLEKSMLDNRKSFLVARISAQVVDYYKEACRALENSETASLLGKIQKDWKKLVQMKIYYFAAIAHFHMGKQAEEQQKFGERLAYLQSSLDKLNEAVKLAKGQSENVQEALRFTMDVIGGKFNSAKKDNDFIYHEPVPALESLTSVKGAPLVKALPVNPTDPSVTGPDIFAKLVPMAAHEASSLYSEEKAKLLRDAMSKIDGKNEILEQFIDSLQVDAETVDNLDLYSHIPTVLMEKCAALSVRPDTVRNLIQSMQVLSGVVTDVEVSLKEIKDLFDKDEKLEQKLQEIVGQQGQQVETPGLSEVKKEWEKYMGVHEKASFTNTELHKAMNLHIGNLRLLSGPLEQLRAALPSPSVTEDDKAILQNMKKMLSKVQEMREQRMSLEKQLRDMIQKDDITTALVTADRSEMKKLFQEQLKKYDQVKVYIEQNLAAQENILKALTEANVKYAAVRKLLTESEHKWNTTVQTLVASFEAYEDLMKKSQEGKEFYADLESKVSCLLEKAKSVCQAREEERQQILEREMKKRPPPRPTAPKPPLQKKASEVDLEPANLDELDMHQFSALALSDFPEELRSLPPGALAQLSRLPMENVRPFPVDPRMSFPGGLPHVSETFAGARIMGPAQYLPSQNQPVPSFSSSHFNGPVSLPGHVPSFAASGMSSSSGVPGVSHQVPFPVISHGGPLNVSGAPSIPLQMMQPSASQPGISPQNSGQMPTSGAQVYAGIGLIRGPASNAGQIPLQPGFSGVSLAPQKTSPHHIPASVSSAPSASLPFSTCDQDMSYRTGHPIPSSGTLPGIPPGVSTVRPVAVCLPGSAHLSGVMHGSSEVLQHPQSARPSTTTVDSIQGPISSYTPTSHAMGGPVRPMLNQQPGPLPQQSGYGLPAGPHMGQASHYTYPQSGVQQFGPQSLPQFPTAGPPTQMFQQAPQLHPVVDIHMRPVRPQQQYPQQPPFTPQSRPQMQHHSQPQLQHSASFQPQIKSQIPQQVVPHMQTPFTGHPVQPQLLPQTPCQPQIQTQIRPHLYQHSAQEKLPQQGLPAQPGILSFPSSVTSSSSQPGHNIPHTIIASTQQVHMHPPSAGLPPAPPGSAGQTVSSVPFGPGSSAIHPGTQPALLNQILPGQQVALGALPSTATGQPAPVHAPPPSSPALSQMQASVIGSGPSMPSPSPSPQPPMVLPSPALMQSSGTAPTSLPQRPPSSLTPVAGSINQTSTDATFSRSNSSTDDLLSSSPESQHGGSKTSVSQPLLQPTKADAKDGQKPKMIQLIENDPYEKPEHITKLLSELVRFRGVVEALDKPVSGTLTELDCKWKELQDSQEKDARQLSIAIARCYTMKNRHQDIMPYDKNRIVLQSGKDDYINASKIEDLSSYCPTVIVTQAPLSGTASDFWLMVYEQKVSLIVMLVSEQELEKQKVVRYFPTERGQQMVQGVITLTLTSQRVTETHIERMIALQFHDQSLKRTVIHLQFTSWPELGLPDSKSRLLRFIQEVHEHYRHQRPLHTPVVVHCSSGVGRTGVFCLMYAAMQEVEAGNAVPDLTVLVRKMRQQRKHMLQEKLHLKYSYEAILKHVEQVLQRHGVSVPFSTRPSSSTAQKSYMHQDSQDIVLGGDMPISSIQATIAKLSIRPPMGADEVHQDMPPADYVEQELQEISAFAATDSSSVLAVEAPLFVEQPTLPSPIASPPLVNFGTGSTENCNTLSLLENNDQSLIEASASPPAPLADCQAVPAGGTTSSSLDLLASMTPEAFTLDSSMKGRQKISKHNFLQPQNGQGLRGSKSIDDPLSMLDPLWTLNKT